MAETTQTDGPKEMTDISPKERQKKLFEEKEPSIRENWDGLEEPEKRAFIGIFARLNRSPKRGLITAGPEEEFTRLSLYAESLEDGLTTPDKALEFLLENLQKRDQVLEAEKVNPLALLADMLSVFSTS